MLTMGWRVGVMWGGSRGPDGGRGVGCVRGGVEGVVVEGVEAEGDVGVEGVGVEEGWRGVGSGG